MDEAILLWSVVFSGIGVGFFSYGRKQKSIVPLLTGIALFAYPYFMPNTTMLVVVGIVLICIPYLTKFF